MKPPYYVDIMKKIKNGKEFTKDEAIMLRLIIDKPRWLGLEREK